MVLDKYDVVKNAYIDGNKPQETLTAATIDVTELESKRKVLESKIILTKSLKALAAV